MDGLVLAVGIGIGTVGLVSPIGMDAGDLVLSVVAMAPGVLAGKILKEGVRLGKG
jgi:hypothetical protein